MIQTNAQNIEDNGDNLGILEGRVAVNGGDIVSTNRRIDENKAYINENTANIDENRGDISTIQANTNQNDNAIARLSIRGAHCGYRHHWTARDKVITYEKMMLNTGSGSLATGAGTWSAEHSGLYQVSWSMHCGLINNQENFIYLYKNGKKMGETRHQSYYTHSEGFIGDQGGKTLVLKLQKDDQLHLQTDTRFEGDAWMIYFCVHLLSAD